MIKVRNQFSAKKGKFMFVAFKFARKLLQAISKIAGMQSRRHGKLGAASSAFVGLFVLESWLVCNEGS